MSDSQNELPEPTLFSDDGEGLHAGPHHGRIYVSKADYDALRSLLAQREEKIKGLEEALEQYAMVPTKAGDIARFALFASRAEAAERGRDERKD
mgnify:FL=1